MKKQKHHSKIYKIDGVGINLNSFFPIDNINEKTALRESKGFSKDDFIITYTAEFIPRKNHKFLFKVLPKLKSMIPNLKVVLCGKGVLLEKYKKLTTNKKYDFVVFTGYTKEVDKYYKISDICISTSMQEGQGINLVEGMATGLPLVASSIRGHNDVIHQFINGIRFDLKRPDSFVDAIVLLYRNPSLCEDMGKRNIIEAKKYSIDIAVQHMADIYSELLK